MYLTALFFAFVLLVLPAHRLVFALTVTQGDEAVLSKSPLKLWFLQDKLSALLLTLLEFSKPILLYVLLRTLFKDDIFALESTALFSVAAYVFRQRFYKSGKTPLYLIAFLWVLMPVWGVFFSLFYAVVLVVFQRPFMAFSLFLLGVPVALVLTLPVGEILWVSLFVWLFYVLTLKESLLSLYPVKEAPLGRFFV